MDVQKLEVHWRTTNMGRILQHRIYRERLRDLSSLTSVEKRLWSNPKVSPKFDGKQEQS